MVAGAPTYYSLPSILASRMPLALGRDVIGLAPGEDTLATTLRQSGYATGAFSAANPYISSRFGYDEGFAVFRDFLDFENSPTPIGNTTRPVGRGTPKGRLNRALRKTAQAVRLGRFYDEAYFQYCLRIAAPPVRDLDDLRKFPTAETVVGGAEAWLGSLGSRPFFLWIHLMDPHSPYYPPASAFEELTGRKPSARRARYLNEFWNRLDLEPERLQRHKEAVIELYDAAIRGVDSQIAQLVRFLKRSDRWDDCVFALTADHGEEFLDHGRRFHAPIGLAEEIARVPLLIRVPGKVKKEPAAFVLSHLDLAPTLLEILAVAPPPSFQGTSLWRSLEGGITNDAPAITECAYGCTNPFSEETRLAPKLLAVRDGRYKLIIRLSPGAGEEVYDLQTDPGEKSPVAASEGREIRAHLLQAAMEHMRNTSRSQSVDARLKARLRDLRLKLLA